MVKRAQQTVKKHLKLAGYGRWFRAFVALVVLISLCVPAFDWIDHTKAYAISPETEKVIGIANKNLSAKFSFDPAGNKWQFNKNGVAALANNIARQQGEKDIDGVAGALSQLAAKQVGGAGEKDQSLYSVDLPARAEEGITYYDNVTRLSFKMTPNFPARDGKLVSGRVVYPFGGGGQIVYTAEAGGLKEDIVLSRYLSDRLSYSYSLDLPETLEARILDNGAVGIYSANPALFGNISFSSDEDKARVMDGRKNGTKDNLVFEIPAPFIKDQTGKAGDTRYYLGGNRLTVVASALKDLKYPLTVDPSVTITSSTDFENGNNEGDGSVTFGSGEVRRGDVSGGTIGTWANPDLGTAFTNARSSHNTVTYNGYIYVIGGAVSGGGTTDVRYAAICNGTNTNGGCTAGASNAGKVGTWTSGGTLTEGRGNNGVAVYNGYIYVVGGSAGGANISQNVQYSQIGANGAPGTWTNLGTFTTNISNSDLVAYNGYLYIAGGCTNLSAALCSTFNGNVYYAAINGNGTLGSWTQLSSTPLSSARYGHTTFAYNGYMYALGGCTAKDVLNNCTTTTTTTEYAKINADGTLGSWSANTALTTARRELKSTVSNGYVYITGDNAISSYISYAPIHASGIIGAWSSATTYATSKKDVAMANYNGYLYITGGCTSNISGCNGGSGFINVSEYVKIDAAGSVGLSNTANDFDSSGNGRIDAGVAAAFGYLYVIGGWQDGATYLNTVRFAPINADGSVGTWSSTNAFAEQRSAASVAVHNGYLYLIGGHNGQGTANCPNNGIGVDYCSNIEWASINPTTGALTWQGSTFTYSSQGRSSLGSVVLNGYLYVLGGIYNNNTNQSTEVNYAQFNADGTLGVFSQTTASMLEGRGGPFAAMAHNGRIYAINNRTSKTTEYATPASNGDITSWTATGGVLPGNDVQSATATTHKGYIYVSGGQAAGGGLQTQIQIAKINSDGSLGSWSISASGLNSARRNASSVIYNDNLYIIGGDSGTIIITPMLNVWYHRIGNGGGGMTGSWSNHSSMATARAAHATVTYNGYIYAIGGCSGVATSVNSCANANILSTVTHASISSSGAVGSWSTPSNLPSSVARFGLSAAVYNGYLYISGGCSATTTNDCTSFQSDVHYAQIASDGSLGSWASGGSFTTGRLGHSMVANNGYLYVLGGCSAMTGSACTNFQSDVQYSQIGSNGLPGTWSSAGTSFTTGRFYQSAVVNSNNLYVLGGCSATSGTDCTTIQSDIRRIALNTSTGALSGSWTIAGATPKPRYGMAAQSYNGNLYILGGCGSNSSGSCNTIYGDIEYVPMTASGLGANWNRSATDFSNARLLHGAVMANGYLALVGGNASGTFQSQSHTSPISVIDRVGQYSKLVSVNPTTSIAGVYYNGTLDGGSSVEYRVAPNTGVFGVATPATQGSGAEPTPFCGTGTIYYVQVLITLGDRTNTVFGDDSISNVTDVTIYYRLNATPTPNLRLNGGKWFYSEVQQPLDICKD